MWPHMPGFHHDSVRRFLHQQRKMLDEMEQWLARSMSQNTPPVPVHPPMIHDNGDHWLFRAHLPGFDKESVTCIHKDGWCHLEAKAKNQQQFTAPNTVQFTQHHGQWRYSFPVPLGTRHDGAKPAWNGDLLEIKFPKSK
jgi:HSP20 family molecular chaperone IbpA